MQPDGLESGDLGAPRVQYWEYGWSSKWAPTEAARRIFDYLETTASQWRPLLQPQVRSLTPVR